MIHPVPYYIVKGFAEEMRVRTPETVRLLWPSFAALVLAAFGLNWLWEMVRLPAYVETASGRCPPPSPLSSTPGCA
jgi:hypothetical protein